jgi:hypothetical protein
MAKLSGDIWWMGVLALVKNNLEQWSDSMEKTEVRGTGNPTTP